MERRMRMREARNLAKILVKVEKETMLITEMKKLMMEVQTIEGNHSIFEYD
jgi:hypothetical protein